MRENKEAREKCKRQMTDTVQDIHTVFNLVEDNKNKVFRCVRSVFVVFCFAYRCVLTLHGELHMAVGGACSVTGCA